MKFATKPYDDDSTHLTYTVFFKNRLRFDKVEEFKSGNFLGTQCIAYFSNANSRTASLLFSVLDLTYEIN